MNQISFPLWNDSTFAIDMIPSDYVEHFARKTEPIADMAHVLGVVALFAESARCDIAAGMFETARLKLNALHVLLRVHAIELGGVVDMLRAVEFVGVFTEQNDIERDFARHHRAAGAFLAFAIAPESYTLEVIADALAHVDFKDMAAWHEITIDWPEVAGDHS